MGTGAWAGWRVDDGRGIEEIGMGGVLTESLV